MQPAAVQKAHCEVHLSALHIHPTIETPLGVTMPRARRAAPLGVVKALGQPIIEDDVCGFIGMSAML